MEKVLARLFKKKSLYTIRTPRLDGKGKLYFTHDKMTSCGYDSKMTSCGQNIVFGE